ncbi:MAG: metal-sulfur cluster assembly factor [Spirochaetia bacterium]|nr:metal-sulfur cluster assembly factor [Spirochaetia bacterium]
MYSKEELLVKLRPVEDPEIGFSIVDMGLIYELYQDEEERVHVKMTLTTPMCPIGPSIGENVKQTLLSDPHIPEVDFEWTFSPPWDPKTMANDEVKWEMGIFS